MVMCLSSPTDKRSRRTLPEELPAELPQALNRANLGQLASTQQATPPCCSLGDSFGCRAGTGSRAAGAIGTTVPRFGTFDNPRAQVPDSHTEAVAGNRAGPPLAATSSRRRPTFPRLARKEDRSQINVSSPDIGPE
jgi:hypothetical protein